jgi:hypothetical protein
VLGGAGLTGQAAQVLSRADEIRSVVGEHGLVLSNFASNQNLDDEGSMDIVRQVRPPDLSSRRSGL